MFESISQSKEFASEYDQKKEALLKAKEDTHFHFNKKKSAAVERKQVSQEKIEVESHTKRITSVSQTTGITLILKVIRHTLIGSYFTCQIE